MTMTKKIVEQSFENNGFYRGALSAINFTSISGLENLGVTDPTSLTNVKVTVYDDAGIPLGTFTLTGDTSAGGGKLVYDAVSKSGRIEVSDIDVANSVLPDPRTFNGENSVGIICHYEVSATRADGAPIVWGGGRSAIHNAEHLYPAGSPPASAPYSTKNVYDDDGTLSGNRTVNQDGKTMQFSDVGKYQLRKAVNGNQFFFDFDENVFKVGVNSSDFGEAYISLDADGKITAKGIEAAIESNTVIKLKDGNTASKSNGAIPVLANSATGEVVYHEGALVSDESVLLLPFGRSLGNTNFRYGLEFALPDSRFMVITTNMNGVHNRAAIRIRNAGTTAQGDSDTTVVVGLNGSGNLRYSAHHNGSRYFDTYCKIDTDGFVVLVVDLVSVSTRVIVDCFSHTIPEEWSVNYEPNLPSGMTAITGRNVVDELRVDGDAYNDGGWLPIASSVHAHDVFEMTRDMLDRYVFAAGRLQSKRPNGQLGHVSERWTMNQLAEGHREAVQLMADKFVEVYPEAGVSAEEWIAASRLLPPSTPIRVPLTDELRAVFPDASHDPHDPKTAILIPDGYTGDLVEVAYVEPVYEEIVVAEAVEADSENGIEAQDAVIEQQLISEGYYTADEWCYVQRLTNAKEAATSITLAWAADATFRQEMRSMQGVAFAGAQVAEIASAVKSMPATKVAELAARQDALLDVLSAFGPILAQMQTGFSEKFVAYAAELAATSDVSE